LIILYHIELSLSTSISIFIKLIFSIKIEVDGVIGVSAGATFGCNYKSKQIGRTIRYNMKYCNDPRYCSFRSLLKTGDLYGAEFCYHTLPEQLDIFDNETYEASPMEFYMVTTDVNTGEPVYYKCDKFDHEGLEWVRASASMPLVSRIVEVGGRQMLDGGISDSIPLQYFQSIGYNKNLVILTQPRDYVKKEKLPIGRIEHHPERLKAVYDIGRETALEHLDEIKKFFQQ